ncbi:MAG: hypothetical protein ABSC05_08770 [Candidatus Solibacter sp.]|jgi:hypothetical protein
MPGAGPIFEHKGYTSTTGIQYVPALQRFIMGQWAYKPWGPWRLFHAQAGWGPSFYCPNFPAKWFENGGRRMWIVEAGNYRGPEGGYNFTVQQLELLV